MMTGMRIACTLAAGDLAAQRERSGRLIAASALERTRAPGRPAHPLRRRAAESRTTSRALVATERECCAWATLVGHRRRSTGSCSTSHRPATASRRSTPCSRRRPTSTHTSGRWRSNDTHVAFAEAAANDGIELQAQSFDWLCEQGHVGLERVAKARRDPALVAPAKAAIELLSVIFARLKGDVSVLHAARENLLLPVELAHVPTGTRDRGVRAAPLHLVSPRGARSLPRRTPPSVRHRGAQAAVP